MKPGKERDREFRSTPRFFGVLLIKVLMSDIESIYGRESVLSKHKKVNEPIDVKHTALGSKFSSTPPKQTPQMLIHQTFSNFDH